MAGYKLGAFKGRYPGVDFRSIPNSAATIATDLKLGFGDIRPLYEDLSAEYTLTPRDGEDDEIQSLHRYLDQYWLHFSTPTSFVSAPIGEDRWARVIFTHDEYDADDLESIPAPYVAGIIPGGEEPNEVTQDYPDTPQMPGSWKALGVPRPSTAPVASYSGGLGDVEDQRTVFYCFTVVNDRGEESAPSDPSGAVTINEGFFDGDEAGVRVTLSFVVDEDVAAGPYNDVAGGDTTMYRPATSLYLYRLFAEDSTQTWMFVKEIAVTGSTISNVYDDYPTSMLPGDVLETFDWIPPPLGLRGIRSMPNGAIVGFKGNEVIFSEPWYPYAYPIKYRYAVEHEIVGIGIFGSSVAVLTTAQPFVLIGAHPAEMTMSRIDADQSCVSRRSIVDFGDRVVWASPDGLFSVGADGVTAITGAFVDKRTWRNEFFPDTIVAASYEGRYVATYTGGTTRGFTANPYSPDEGIVDTTTAFTASYRDYVDDALYLVKRSEAQYRIFSFDADTDNPREWEWRSKCLEFPAHVNLGRAQVVGRQYPFEIDTALVSDTGAVSVYTNGATTASRNAIALRAGTLSTDWLVTIRGTGVCEYVVVGETMKDIKAS